MKHQTRSVFHFVLLFVFIFSQVMVQPVAAAGTTHPNGETILQGEQSVQPPLSEAMPGPAPVEKDSLIVSANNFKSVKSSLDIAADLQLLGYTLPTYEDGIYLQENGLSIEPLVAYNLIVDSNVLSPSSYGPSAGTFGAKYCNTGSSNLTDVWAYIGNYDADYDGEVGGTEPATDAVAGSFPRRGETAPTYDDPGTEDDLDPFNTAYGASTTNPLVGTTITDYGAANAPFALQLASGSTATSVDGSRYMGTLAPGECKTQYWLVTYPRKACSSGTVCDINNTSREDVTGGVKPDDDLWLPYFFWGTSTSGATTATSYRWNAVTMRNEISAMANKIWPNSDNKVPDQYLQAIQEVLGWDTITPTGTSNVYPGETVVSQGIWYDLGNVGAGFDNNGDFVPDRNVWLQPIGDASGYDPGCFRLVRTYGLVIIKLNDGTEQLIPFVDQMYFENIPDNNNGAVGLVFYEYAALDGICTASLTPYQEVASGYDNEKFNADFGAGIPPLQTQESNMTLEKTEDGSIARTGTINYSLTFTLPDANPATTTTFTVGQPSYGMPLTYSDAVPVGLQYVANSASTTVDMSSSYTPGDITADLWHSKDAGATWSMGDPGDYTSTVANPLVLQWRLQSGVTSPASGAAYTGTVTFQAVVPDEYTPIDVKNEACLKIGSGPGFVCDDHTTLIEGTNWLGGLAWRDDGTSGGVLANALRDGGESVIGSVTVNLYYDSNNDGVGDAAFGSVETLPYPVVNGYLDYDRDGITAGDTGDTGVVAGVSIVNGRLDLNGVGGVTIADDGTFLGYVVIDGYLDIDRDDAVSGDADDDLAQGSYRFGALPNGSYVVTVDQGDSDIPTGYTPTNRTTRTASLSAVTPSVTGLDFGFGPVLALDKYITPTTYAEGDTMSYTIKVTNMLPGSSSGVSACSYYVWANTVYPTTWTGAPDGGGPDNSQWQDTTYAIGIPDERFSYSAMNDNTDTLGLSGYNIGDMGGTITSVQYVVNVHERVNLSTSDRFFVNVFYNDVAEESVEYYGTGAWEVDNVVQSPATSYFTGGTGTEYIIVRTLDPGKITNRVAPNNVWRWSDFTNNLMELQVEANKGSNSGDINLDGAGFIVTTNQACGGSASTLNPVPLADAFDNTYLRYLSASPSISSQSTSGSTTTLSWSNVGPLDPGETKLITVNFEALAPVSPTVNTATSTNAKFVDGRAANTPVTDTASVTITSIGSISGRIWHNADADGWVGTNGYETGEVGIGGVNVRLYACQVAGVSIDFPVDNNEKGRTCSVIGGTWQLLSTITTEASGNYLFGDLVPGFYYVDVEPNTWPSGASFSGERDTGATGDQDGASSATSDNRWGLRDNALTDSGGALALFNYLDSGEHITNVNFGYYGFTPAMYGYVWQDYDGDGVRDSDEPGINNITVSLVDCGPDHDCSETSEDNLAAITQSTDSTGLYMFENRTLDSNYKVTVTTTTGALSSGTWTNTDEDAPVTDPPINDDVAPQGTTGNSILITENMEAGDLLGGYNFGYHQSGTYSIGDTLWYDWNGDADWDTATEETISNVTVRLYSDADNDGVVDITDPLVRTTVTLAYRVIDGYVDMDRNGATAGDAHDAGTLGSYTVINGRLDISGNGTLGSEDDGAYLGLTVIDGYLDIDSDDVVSGDADDDLGVGQYQFMKILPGNYIVKIDTTDADFSSGMTPTYDSDEGSQGTLCATCDSLSTVTVGPNNADQDFGYQPTGSGRIGDTVFKDINGNGTQDGTGETGISGVTVQLLADWNGDGNYVVVDTKTTDSNGRYLFTSLPAGTYRVSINLSSNASAIPDDLFGNNYLPSNGANTGTIVYMDKSLATATSSDLTADFGFAPPASIGDTVYQDVNRNGTQDLNEPGINGVPVTLYTFTDSNGNSRYDPAESGTLVSTGLTATTATIGERSGIYQFDGLEPGYYVVQPTPPAGAVLTADPNTDGFSCDDLSEPAGPGEPSVNLCDNSDGMRLYNNTNYTGADFGYYVPGVLGDTLWIDTDNDGTRDATEVGIPNVTVRLCNDIACADGDDLQVATDADGYYYFTGLTNDSYYVVVDTSDTDLTSRGLTQTYEARNNVSGGTDDKAAPDPLTQVHLTSGVVDQINGNGCTNCSLDLDFGYDYDGDGALSGTICLETVDNGICGTGATGVDPSNESAYRTVTVFLYRWVDDDHDGNIDSGETNQVAVTWTDTNGNYFFTDLSDGVYYIVAIGTPQSGLNLNTDVSDLPEVGDDTNGYEDVVATTNLDGTVLSVYQIVEVASSDPVVENVDFAFSLKGTFDFGDLPDSYATTLQGTPDGPRHKLPTGGFTLYFGSTPDVEANGTPNLTASGDGTDEDGVSVPIGGLNSSWADGNGGTLQFNIVGSGWLVGWFDLNRDGDFADANEMVVDRSVSTGPLSVNVTALSGLADGSYYARFRLFTAKPAISALAYSGATINGEVEDYRFDINGGTPTPVTLSYFYARRKGSTVSFEWSTATETGNVGFNLYVQGKDGLVQLNDQLIPSKVIDSLDRQDYTYSIDVAGNQFYIEDVSIQGEIEIHGPFQIGRSYGGLQKIDKINQKAVLAEHNKKFIERQTAIKNKLTVPAEARKAPSWFSFGSRLQLNTTFDLKVRETGIYRVTYEMLKTAGLDLNGVPSTKITVTNRGKQIPIYVAGKTKFGPGSFIEFYGEALDTIYTDTNIYTLQVSRARADRIKEVNASPARKTTPATDYVHTLRSNHQRVYSNSAPGQDAWYDTRMLVYTKPASWKFPFQISSLADPSAPANLDLVVWGVTDWPQSPDHHLIVSVNGTMVADQTFNGLVEKNIAITLPADVLHEGENLLELMLPGDTGVKYDLINFDKFSITYQRSLQAMDGQLTFSASGKALQVTNLPDKNVVVYRMNESGTLVRLKKIQIVPSGGTYTATFAGTGNKVSKYFVTTTDSMYSPVMEATRLDTDLDRPARYLIISHPDFIAGLQPLVQARQAQGLSVSVVDVTDVYAQYADGVFDPQAIKDYIAHAAGRLGTEYVLLVGGDTYDYRNYLGQGSISFIPSLYATTGEVAKFVPVDPLYADVNSDNVPDLAIGRFPVRTTAELALMVNKTLTYANKDYDRTALFVSDAYDGIVSYKDINTSLAASLTGNWSVDSVHLDDLNVSTARSQILSSMNKGVALVTFTGHSSPTVWTFKDLFSIKNARALTNHGKPFVVVQWGCWNTYYVDPANNYLVQSFLFSGDQGAVSVLGASTLTDSRSEELLGGLLTPRMVTPGTPIGLALRDAKFELAQTHPELLDVLLGWSLMGDPALTVTP